MGTYNRHLSELRVIFKRLKTEASTKTNPFESIDLFSAAEVLDETTHKEPFTLEELKLIQNKARGWMELAFNLAFYTSLRIGDILTLKWEQIDFEGGFIDLRSKKNRTRKNSREALFYVPDSVEMIENWREKSKELKKYDEEYIFYLAHDVLRYNSTSYPCRLITIFLEKIKINTKNEDGQNIKGVHSFRKSYATFSALRGVELSKIAQQLTDTEQVTSASYIMLNDDQQKLEAVTNYLPVKLDESTEDERLLQQMQRLYLMLSDEGKKKHKEAILG